MDVPMKLVTILVFLVHSHSTFCSVVEAKRYDHTMVDPLTRRSPLDKNFMRFGRSSNTQDRVHEEAGETSPNSIDTQDDFLSDKDTFDRYARGKYDSFIRFGRDRGSQNFIRFGRSRNPQNFIRFGRGRNENFIRFGRDNQYTVPKDFQIDGNERSLDINTAEDKRKDNFLRFGRGRHENFIRFGRSLREDEQDNENNIDESNIPISMRAGGTRGNSNFLRFGRRQENFIRFGRGGQDRNFLRFGRASNRNFMRFGRAGNRNFMRFGRSDEPEDNKSFLFDESTPTFDQDDESFDRSIRDRELTRLGRQLPSERGDGFIRFGRNVEKESENNSSTGRDKRSIMDGNERAKRSILEDPSSGQVYTDMNTEDNEESTPEIFKLNSRSYFPVDIDDEYESGSIRRDFWNRKKRSLKDSVHTESPEILSATGNGVSRQIFDDQLQYDLPPLDYYPSPLSAGIPNFIVGPEFSLLPPLDVSTSKFKKGRPGDRNFIRLG